MQARKTQTAYNDARAGSGLELESRIQTAMYRYLRDDLGLSEPVASDRAAIEIAGTIGRNVCDDCEKAGLTLRGKRVLDLGTGLGALSVELSRRGALVTGIEPGAAWRKLAADRLAAAGSGSIVGSVGEHLPFRDDSIDLIVSLQVLEHVQNPQQVISEAFRVLKPGGHIYITYENYLSFWEPHYRVRWLPLLPKSIGSVYLKARGRNPRFLWESITYTIFPVVRSAFLNAGFECMRLKGYKDALHSPQRKNIKWRVLKTIAAFHESLALWLLSASDYASRVTQTAIDEFMQKPIPISTGKNRPHTSMHP